MACFTCGRTFSKSIADTVKKYKAQYEKFGIERYVYKTSSNSDILITKKEYFNEIFEKSIKPNLEKGAEYFHISEYSGT